jgi:TetR/AcrR family transcriptional regulator
MPKKSAIDLQARMRPGRPRGRAPELSRQALLDAARDLFARREFAAVSLRQIATQAKVNPAMIHYHFGGKEGLYTAMLEERFAPLLQQLELQPAERPTLSQFVELYVRMLAANQWLPNLVVREVLYGDSSLRETFIQRFAARAGQMVPALIREECDRGILRTDLDPRLATLSLLSMAVFPFISRPVVEPVFGVDMDEGFVQRWIDHALRLFYEGAEVKK